MIDIGWLTDIYFLFFKKRFFLIRKVLLCAFNVPEPNKVASTLFGSGTLKAHQNTILIKKKHFFKNRQEISVNQPISIIAGNSKNFSKSWSYFNQPIKRWLLQNQDEKNELVLPNGFDKKTGSQYPPCFFEA